MNLKVIVLSFLTLQFIFADTLLGQTMDFEEYNPPSTLVVPENPVFRAKFPFIDVHSHHWNMADKDLDQLAKEMDAMNMAVMVNLSGGNGERITRAAEHIKKNQPQRFILFANIDFSDIGSKDWTDKAVEQLEKDVKNGANGLKVFKNLGLSVKDHKGNRVTVDDVRLDPIWAKCGELGIPVLIHSADPKPFWEPFDANNERWLELKTHSRRKRDDSNPAPWETIIAEQHRMFAKHPGTTFINAHMGWFANDLAKLSILMEQFPNMMVEIGAIIAELGRQPKMAHKFMVKYQDRVLFGKDSYKPEEYPTYFRVLETEDEYFPYYKKYHAFWRMYGLGLPDEVLKKIYYKNALKIIPNIDSSLFPN